MSEMLGNLFGFPIVKESVFCYNIANKYTRIGMPILGRYGMVIIFRQSISLCIFQRRNYYVL